MFFQVFVPVPFCEFLRIWSSFLSILFASKYLQPNFEVWGVLRQRELNWGHFARVDSHFLFMNTSWLLLNKISFSKFHWTFFSSFLQNYSTPEYHCFSTFDHSSWASESPEEPIERKKRPMDPAEKKLSFMNMQHPSLAAFLSNSPYHPMYTM